MTIIRRIQVSVETKFRRVWIAPFRRVCGDGLVTCWNLRGRFNTCYTTKQKSK